MFLEHGQQPLPLHALAPTTTKACEHLPHRRLLSPAAAEPCFPVSRRHQLSGVARSLADPMSAAEWHDPQRYSGRG